MAKRCGCFFVFLLFLAAIAVRLASGGPHADQQHRRHVRESGSGETQCQPCSHEVSVRVNVLEDCSSSFEIIKHNNTLKTLENRIKEVLNISVVQEQVISSLVMLVEALEEKVDNLRGQYN